MTLANKTVAISIGDAPDRHKLGYPAREVQRALFTVCGAFVRGGARISYAGDFRADGFTVQMYRHLASAYADREEKPFRHFVPEPVLRRTSFADLVGSLQECQSVADTIVFLGDEAIPVRASDGALLCGTGSPRRRLADANAYDGWLSGSSLVSPEAAYSFARRQQSEMSDARVAMGGKMGLIDLSSDAYEGVMPGVAEEAILALQSGKPWVPLAAYGGATRDIAIALGLLDTSGRTPRGQQTKSYDPAIGAAGALSSRIPATCLADLKQAAAIDRVETLAKLSCQIVANWRAVPAPY